MSARDQLPTIDLSALSRVTGGASTDLSSMLMPLMMWKNKQQQSAAAPAAAPPPAAPVTPQITLNGVPQTPSSVSSAGTNYTTPDSFGDDF
jgi:hypothetical protein